MYWLIICWSWWGCI